MTGRYAVWGGRTLDLLTHSRSQLQNFVLVAGYDYRGRDASRVDFVQLALNRAAMLRNSDLGRTRFTLFDVARGIVDEQIGYGDEITSVRTVAQYEPIRSTHYEVQPSGIPAFRAVGVRTLSIVDVYDYVLQLGAHEPATLLELAFVSHGWGGGPILVNSFDPTPSHGMRNYDDKDGRVNKDFAAPNMSSRKRRLFRAAFCARAGRVFNFGCASDAAARDVLDQLFEQWEPTHDSTNIYRFAFNSDRLIQYRTTDPAFFGDELPKVSRSLAQCQAFLHRRKNVSYSQKIADVAGVRCWAAFPGTSSSYEKDVPFPVMSVRKALTESGIDLTSYLRFINVCLGYVGDSKERGFIEFAPLQPKKPVYDHSATIIMDSQD